MPAVDRRTLLLTLGAAALPAPIFAGDPWEKDPTQWTDKDLQKLMTDSPWARPVSVAIGGPSVGGIGGGGRGGRGGRGGGGGGMQDASSSAGMGGSPMGGETSGPGSSMGGEGGGLGPSVTFVIRWQSAKPVKIAAVRARMGAEADTSAQAREFIEKKESDYVIAVIMPPMRTPGAGRPGGSGEGDRGGASPGAEEKIKQSTTLSWKGHDQVHPSSVVMPKPGGQNAFIFHFPRTEPIQLADKEVEFVMRRGSMDIKKKFKLKDMVYQGELAL